MAWVDYNNDRKLDFFIASADGNKLYKGRGDGTFSDVTKESGIAANPITTGAVFGDYDNDGCPDLFLSTGGSTKTSKDPGLPDLLYHNNCNGTFTNVTEISGIRGLYHGTGATWFDYNQDGLLDLYIDNYGVWKSDDDWTYEPNILYRNNGDGTFTDVTKQTGVSGDAKCDAIKPFTRYSKASKKTEQVRRIGGWKESFQPITFDFDNDGKPDLFIATDYGVSPLYHNNGNGTFTDVTEKAGLCIRGSGMGVSAGDYNNEGWLDLYVTNGDRNFLWNNNHDGTFTEVSEENGVANLGSLGWGTGFLDFNNDGYLDIYSVNGTVIMDLEVRKRFIDRKDRLYLNNGEGKFVDIAPKMGILGNDPKLAAAFGDFNDDGFSDIYVVSDGLRKTDPRSHNRLYQNKPNGNHWLKLTLVGTRSNRDSIGARIILTANGKKQIREVTNSSSYLSQNSLEQIFGLGKLLKIDQLEIRWPSGQIQTIYNPGIDRTITVTENR